MVNTTIVIFAFLVLAAGVILLQIYLSKLEIRWPGLILPIISLLISLYAVLGVAAFTSMKTTTVRTLDENGVVIEETVTESESQANQSLTSAIVTMASVFIFYNTPTTLLLAIYFGCRHKQRQRKALEKMRAQDLE